MKHKPIHMRDFDFYNTPRHHATTTTIDRTQRFLKLKYYTDDKIIMTLESKNEIYRKNKYVRYEYTIRMITPFEDTTRKLDIDELHKFITKN